MSKNRRAINGAVHHLTRGAVIAALYTVLTLLANAFGLANNAVQLRFSEALCVLPAFMPEAVPGLFIGCVISNILTGCALWDVVFGSLATLIGAFFTMLFFNSRAGKSRLIWLAPLPPVISNTLIIPFVISYVYGSENSIPFLMLTVGAGELLSCALLGTLLTAVIMRRFPHIAGGGK